jgi:hypothetical protein
MHFQIWKEGSEESLDCGADGPKVVMRSAGQQLQFDFPAGISISVVHDNAPMKGYQFLG